MRKILLTTKAGMLFSVLVLVNCSDEQVISQTSKQKPFVVSCLNEKLPEFSLGIDSNLSKDEVEALCSCIWNRLNSSWARRTSVAIVEGREADVSSVHMYAFPAKFGSAISKCGGLEM